MSDETQRTLPTWIALVIVPLVLALPGCAGARQSATTDPVGTDPFTRVIREAGDLRGVAFSPDGTLVAGAGGNDHTALIWSTATGKQLKKLTGDAVVDHVAFSPDGRYLATTNRLFDTQTGESVAEFGGGGYDVAFSPDGKLVATANGYMPNGVRLFDAANGRLVHEVTTEYATSVAFSPDGKLLAAALKRGTVLWDTQTYAEARTIQVEEAMAVQFSPDGKVVATSSAKGVRLWNAAIGEHLRDLDGAAQGLAFSLDGKLFAAAGEDRAVRLYDPATGGPLTTLKDVYALRLAFSPDGKYIAVVTPDKTLRIAALT